MLSVLASTLLCLAPQGAPLRLLATDPPANTNASARSGPLRFDFDRSVDLATVAGNVHVVGENTGPRTGTWSATNGGASLLFTPAQPFAGGEKVRVRIGNGLTATDGTSFRRAGHAFEFRAFASRAALEFAPADSRSLRAPNEGLLRIYGGQAVDLDRDHAIDLAVIDEDAWDVRVLLNHADGTGQFRGPVGQPQPIGQRPSPNEMADLDGDGFIDLCTANAAGGNVTVLLGNGDGTFRPGVEYAVGSNPRGLAVLDVDGDGDEDLATANHGSDDLCVLFNNGSGVFSSPVFFDGGGVGEYALAAGDLDLDGRTDLVVGMRTSARIGVLLGNGDGTFRAPLVVDAGGQAWKVVLGDVDGDGDLDAATANSFSDTGSILLNDGSGLLALSQVVPGGPLVVAPDLGDMDGDGDLDLVLSMFNGGEWRLFTNDGQGSFAFARAFPALSHPACCVMFDMDGDGDLDLALLDELADYVTFQENLASNERRYCFGDAFGALCPCAQPGDPGRGCQNSALLGGVNLSSTAFEPLGNGEGLVRLVARGFPSGGTPTALLVRSRIALASGVALGDGLLCVGAPVARLEATTVAAGATGFDLIHRAGSGPFLYQVAYRDPATFCTPMTLNFSNGIELVWD